METSTILELKFKTSENKNKTISIKNAKPDITQEVAKSTIEAISTLPIFSKDGIQSYQTPIGARYVSRQVTEIYAPEV